MITASSTLEIQANGTPSGNAFQFARNAEESQETDFMTALIAVVGEARIAAETTALQSLATITADRDRLAALLTEASAAFDEGDVAKLTSMRKAALQTENEKKLAAALAKKAEAEAEIAALAK